VIRVIDDVVYEVKPGEALELVSRQLGLHREAVIYRPLCMVELDAPETILQWWREEAAKPLSAAKRRERDDANRERQARRQKIEARRRCKAIGATTLLTGTYRALQADPVLAWRHFEEFVRRVRRVIPDFAYVVAWEPQKRGALHWHAAVPAIAQKLVVGKTRVKSYDLMRNIWRSVVGELGGTVNHSKYTRFKRRSPGQIAAYLSKYMHKTALRPEFDGHRVWSSSRVDIERPTRLRFAGESVLALVDLAHSWVSDKTRELCSAWVAAWGDTVFLAAEPIVARSIACR